MTNRRDFVKAAAAAAVSAIPSAASGGQAASIARANSQNSDLLRPPDHVTARFGPRTVIAMQYSAGVWTCPGIRVSADPETGHVSELPIRGTNEEIGRA